MSLIYQQSFIRKSGGHTPSACRKSSPAAIFSDRTRFPCAFSAAGETRRETLLRKASESTAHVAGFGIQLGGLRPSEPTGKFFDSLWPSASARKPGGRFAFRGLGRSAQGVKQRKAPLAFASAPRRKKVQRAFQGKVGYVQRRKAAFTGQHILIEEGDGVGGGQRCLD